MRILAVFLVFLLSASATAEMPVRELSIADQILSVEVAHTPIARSRGLMFRQSLDENNGMLFVFPEAGRHSMWMMNTDIPLSVAFVDEKGIILNLADMMPRTATAHRSAGPAKYAVEMNLGWFAAKKITPGERVMGLEKLPAAE
ncbi:MAG: DUF192 domain-containing protein [Nitrosospira sp.]|nr:DUF192 domain-containing protein [Nitrosospira sp.]